VEFGFATGSDDAGKLRVILGTMNRQQKRPTSEETFCMAARAAGARGFPL
jgi:hypothetical protein